jgi:endonuclease/exonuclease/phosphatase family metal-dependent hydrolase
MKAPSAPGTPARVRAAAARVRAAAPPVPAAAPVVLVAAVFVAAVELLRATGPLLDRVAGEVGIPGAAGLAVLIFAAPALIGGAAAVAGAARAAVGVVAALAILRLVAQAQDPPTLLVVGAGAATGLAALVLAVRRAASGVAAAAGILLGTAADVAIRAAYGSWDPVFRPGALPWLSTVAVLALATVAVLASRNRTGPPDAPGAGVLGVYLALYAMAYGSAPILAAHAGVSMPLAAAMLIATAAAGVELVRRRRLPASGAVALLGLAGGVAAAYWLTGPAVLVAIPVAGLAAAVLLARALTSRPHPVRHGIALAGLLTGLGYVVPVLIYQVHYDLEFPFDNRFVLLATALMLGLAGLRRRPPARAAGRRYLVLVAAALILLGVPAAVALTRPAVGPPDQYGTAVRLLTWNVRYGQDHATGAPDPAALADAIAAADPDVVLLQEVGRGWPIGGGLDLLEWLSRRLAMRYEWAPAANGQFGNALLTRLPLSEVETGRLPFGQGPMERSYVAATVHLDGGRELRVLGTHLQHRKENTATRLAQSEALLAVWDGAPRTVVAGDLNFWPTWQEPGLWTEAGFISAQDVTGHGAGFTSPTDHPDNRVDWIFGTPDLAFSDFAILTGVTSSDHFPLVVTVA